MFIKLFEQDIERYEAGEITDEELGRARSHVLNEYITSKRDLAVNTLVLREIIWEDNYDEVFAYIKQAGLKEIIITNKSTELMDIMFYLGYVGIKSFKSVWVEKKEVWEGFDQPQKGLLIKL